MTVIFGLPTSLLATVFFGLAAVGLVLYLSFGRMPIAVAAGAAVTTFALEAAVVAFALTGFWYNVGDQSEDLVNAGSMAAAAPAMTSEKTASAAPN